MRFRPKKRRKFSKGFSVFVAFALFACLSEKSHSQAGLPKGVQSKASEIRFIEGSWTEALKKAQQEHKYIFVDAYAVWCAPCKRMKQTTFSDPAVAAYFNEHFINLSLDAEKGYGVEFATQWNLQSYPTLYFFDNKGRLIARNEGFLDSAQLLAIARKSKPAEKQ